MNYENMDEIGGLLKRIHVGIMREANNSLRPMELTVTQMRVINFLAAQECGYTTQKEIEARFGVSHPTVVGIMKRLESKELIACEIDSNDRRVKLIRLTEQGMQFVKGAEAQRAAMDAHLVKGMTEEEIKELRRLLGMLLKNVNQVSDMHKETAGGKHHG